MKYTTGRKTIAFMLALILFVSIPAMSFAYYDTHYAWAQRFYTIGDNTNTDQHYHIYTIQRIIVNMPNFASFSVDGYWGPTTKGKVMAFQAARNITSDGIVGSTTWANLQARLWYVRNYASWDYYKVNTQGDLDGSHLTTYEYLRHSSNGTWQYSNDHGESWHTIR